VELILDAWPASVGLARWLAITDDILDARISTSFEESSS
jgi:hypothetical protein